MKLCHRAQHIVPSISVFIAVAALLGACGGGGSAVGTTASSGGSGASSASSAASSASSSSVSSSSSAASSSSSSSSRVSLYLSDPVIASCDKGVLKDSERTAALDKVNAVRVRHGLLPVTYDATEDDASAEAALYMVANRTITSTPSSSGLCYTADAARLAASSNLFVTFALTAGATTQDVASTRPIVSYLLNSTSPVLSERRRLLNPFLGKITFGRVDGQPVGASQEYMSAVLKVIGNDVANINAMSNDFVAYPYGIYPAGEYATDGYLSFSAIASKTDAAANGGAQVSFAAATITVSDGGTLLPVTNQAADYSAYGLPNSLQWKVTGLQTNVSYAVQISNVVVNGVTHQYNYTFRLQ
ncbi:MAG: hypothetical protein JWL63_762 [Rhodocyclales bacterium]|nr:hypothetical protein [Rhodocyclales bacterium]